MFGRKKTKIPEGSISYVNGIRYTAPLPKKVRDGNEKVGFNVEDDLFAVGNITELGSLDIPPKTTVGNHYMQITTNSKGKRTYRDIPQPTGSDLKVGTPSPKGATRVDTNNKPSFRNPSVFSKDGQKESRAASLHSTLHDVVLDNLEDDFFADINSEYSDTLDELMNAHKGTPMSFAISHDLFIMTSKNEFEKKSRIANALVGAFRCYNKHIMDIRQTTGFMLVITGLFSLYLSVLFMEEVSSCNAKSLALLFALLAGVTFAITIFMWLSAFSKEKEAKDLSMTYCEAVTNPITFKEGISVVMEMKPYYSDDELKNSVLGFTTSWLPELGKDLRPKYTVTDKEGNLIARHVPLLVPDDSLGFIKIEGKGICYAPNWELSHYNTSITEMLKLCYFGDKKVALVPKTFAMDLDTFKEEYKRVAMGLYTE